MATRPLARKTALASAAKEKDVAEAEFLQMVVDRFTSLDELASIRTRWTELYEADVEANLFLSWEWVSACAAQERQWLVLGARENNSPYVAFLALRFDRFPWLGPAVSRRLLLGLSPRGDFTGVLGAAGAEGRFIPAFARAIEALEWDSFVLNNCADRRVAALVSEFMPDRYRLVSGDATPCPYAELPATWEEYLSTRGSSSRRTIRSHLRKLESLPGYYLHFPASNEAEGAVETLLRVHSSRWKKDLRTWQDAFGGVLARCYALGRFRVAVMYQGETVVAAQGFFIEPARRTIIAYMIGHNPDYAKFSPGMMLGCASIRRAIEEGYRLYNFSLGDQAYKMSLATGVSYVTNATVWRRSFRAAAVNAGRRGFVAAKRLGRKLLRSRG